MPSPEIKRRTLLGLIAGLSIFRPARAAVPDSFALVPQLAIGQTKRYRQQLQMTRNGAVGYRSSARVTASIIDRLDGGWLARWTAEASELHDAAPAVRPLLAAMLPLWDGVPIDLLLDEQGCVTGVANLPTLRAQVAASTSKLLDVLASDPERAALVDTVRAALQPIVSNDTYVAQSVTKEALILFGAMGREYRVGRTLEVKSRIPSPLGSGEIPILGRFKIGGVDARTQRARLNWLMVLDRRQAARLLNQELQGSVAHVAGASLDAGRLLDTAMADLDFDDQGEFEVDIATAWPAKVKHTRRISSAGASRVDVVEFQHLAG